MFFLFFFYKQINSGLLYSTQSTNMISDWLMKCSLVQPIMINLWNYYTTNLHMRLFLTSSLIGSISDRILILTNQQVGVNSHLLNQKFKRDLRCVITIASNTCLWKLSVKLKSIVLKGSLSPIWFISRKMAKQDFVYHCWQWLAVTLKSLLHMLWISHHYETFTECRNEDSVAEIDANSIFMIWGLNPLLALHSSIIVLQVLRKSTNFYGKTVYIRGRKV